MYDYEQRLKAAQNAIKNADHVLIGAGAGLSAAAGLTYSGKRFTGNFADFIKKYGVEDMYSASFYPFPTQEELWAHWARHIDVNRYLEGPTPLYRDLLCLVRVKDFFVITTNVESQFEKADFPMDKIFEVQGNYGYLQCAKGCHSKRYENMRLVKQMVAETRNCKIPSYLVPVCPVCGGPMDVNLRHNNYFVQDNAWYAQNDRYQAYVRRIQKKRTVFLELGVGFNTPGIIRYPFEQMAHQYSHAVLVRMNRDYPMGAKENLERTISFDEDMEETIRLLLSNDKERGNPYMSPPVIESKITNEAR
ncbi:Sir2 silent information regulator family NAD-dependent deacetylase [Lachnospiraceae bacterium 54-53]